MATEEHGGDVTWATGAEDAGARETAEAEEETAGQAEAGNAPVGDDAGEAATDGPDAADEATAAAHADEGEPDDDAGGDEYDAGTIKRILEAALLVAGRPLALTDFEKLFGGRPDAPPRNTLRAALAELAEDWSGRSLALQEVATGFRAQVRTEFEPWLARMWDEKPPRYSRALLETLAIIAYRQPMTRSEIEDIRGVSVSSQIIRTLTEREWIRVVGHREAPGRPAMYGTTREFLDYFNLKSLDQLPPISDVKDLEGQYPELGFEAEPSRGGGDAGEDRQEAAAEDGDGTPAPDATDPDGPVPEDGDGAAAAEADAMSREDGASDAGDGPAAEDARGEDDAPVAGDGPPIGEEAADSASDAEPGTNDAGEIDTADPSGNAPSEDEPEDAMRRPYGAENDGEE